MVTFLLKSFPVNKKYPILARELKFNSSNLHKSQKPHYKRTKSNKGK